MKFTIGSDPEVFLVDSSGNYKSAIPFISGTKIAPEILANGAGLQHDNVAVEFSSPVFNSVDTFIDGMIQSFTLAAKRIPKNYKFAFVASARFDAKELEDKRAQQFGCEPDYCCWSLKMNCPPQPKEFNFRSCGGHVHIGHKILQENMMNKVYMIRIMDCFLGIPSVILDRSPDSIERRLLYGKAGCHRPTEYGVEYRTLSNFWVKDKRLIKLIYYLSEESLKATKRGPDYVEEIVSACGGGDVIQEMINSGDIEMTTHVVNTILKKFLNKKVYILLNKTIWGV